MAERVRLDDIAETCMPDRTPEMELLGGCDGSGGGPIHCTAHNSVILAIQVMKETMKRMEELTHEIGRANATNAQTMAQIGARMEEHISIHKVTEALMKRQEEGDKAQEERETTMRAKIMASAVSSAIHETLSATIPKVIPQQESRWVGLGYSLMEKVLWAIIVGILALVLAHSDVLAHLVGLPK